MIWLRPAGTDAHEADLAEANQRAAAAEREAAMLRAMVEVLRLDRVRAGFRSAQGPTDIRPQGGPRRP